MRKAVSYYRTSSMKNVGEDKDSLKRQKTSCETYSKTHNIDVLNTFYDAGVSGKVSAMERPEFKRMITWCDENNIHTILIEKADRFSRDVIEGEMAFKSLHDMGFDIISASGDVKFDNDIHSSLIRQIMGAWSEYERKNISLRLTVARQRKTKENKKRGYLTIDGRGKCAGRKSYFESNEELVREAKRLFRVNPVTKKKRSLRKISNILFELGYKTARQTPFSATQVKRLVA